MTVARECPPDIVDALIQVEQRDQGCWRLKKYLGSMLTFDFGGRRPVRTLRGTEVELGSSTMSVRDVYWSFQTPGGSSVDSDSVSDEDVRDLDQRLLAATLTGFARDDEDYVLRFSNGIELRIDRTNVYEETPDETIALLQLAGGLQINLMTDGRILLDVEESVREKVAA